MQDFVPRRVVSLQPSVTSTLDNLGLLDRVVAYTKHCRSLVPALNSSKAALVEDSWTAQATQIAAANPDLVIASVPYQLEALAQILAAGIRVLTLAPHNLADIYTDIATIANVMGVPNRGAELVRELRETIEEMRRHTARLSRPRVFCEEWGKPMITSQAWVAELVEASGGMPIGIPGGKTDSEQILAENPEVIIFAWCGASDRVPAEKLITERNWAHLSAVENGRVYVVRDEFLTTPGPPLLTGALALAHIAHRHIFPEPRFKGTNVIRRIERLVVK